MLWSETIFKSISVNEEVLRRGVTVLSVTVMYWAGALKAEKIVPSATLKHFILTLYDKKSHGCCAIMM
jgi:hypothetical protein